MHHRKTSIRLRLWLIRWWFNSTGDLEDRTQTRVCSRVAEGRSSNHRRTQSSGVESKSEEFSFSAAVFNLNSPDDQEARVDWKGNPRVERRKSRRLEKDSKANLDRASSALLERDSSPLLDRGNYITATCDLEIFFESRWSLFTENLHVSTGQSTSVASNRRTCVERGETNRNASFSCNSERISMEIPFRSLLRFSLMRKIPTATYCHCLFSILGESSRLERSEEGSLERGNSKLLNFNETESSRTNENCFLFALWKKRWKYRSGEKLKNQSGARSKCLIGKIFK